MAANNPPGFLQNAGNTHTAQQMRNYFAGLLAGQTGSATAQIPRRGVNPSLGGAYQVTAQASPNMSVLVLPGVAYIPGTENTTQGVYGCHNDANVTIAVTAAHATLARIDAIYVGVRDSFYSGANNDFVIDIITGTPAGSPTAPSVPVNSIRLANINVAAASTSITNAMISDQREYVAALGGVIPYPNAGAMSAGTVFVKPGQLAYDQTLGDLYLRNVAGSGWNRIFQETDVWSSYTPSWTTTGTAPSLGNGTLVGKFKQVGKTVFFRSSLTIGSTTTVGTGNWMFSLPVTAISGLSQTCSAMVAQGSNVYGSVGWINGTNGIFRTYVGSSNTGVSNTVPNAWASTHTINWTGVYEAN